MHSSPHLRLWFLLVVTLGLVLAQESQGQVLVYRLSFEKAGESINYSPYQGGYYVAPVNGGTGTLVLTRTVGGKKYFTYANFGELFVALKDNVRKAVISATAANSVSTTTFFAIGETNDKLEVATRLADEALVATELKGWAVSADSERDLPFSSSNATDIGVAGASILTCKLDQGLTNGAIALGRGLADEVTVLTDELESQGYADGKQATTGGQSTQTGGQSTGTTGTR
jgi:hypothetical protein